MHCCETKERTYCQYCDITSKLNTSKVDGDVPFSLIFSFKVAYLAMGTDKMLRRQNAIRCYNKYHKKMSAARNLQKCKFGRNFIVFFAVRCAFPGHIMPNAWHVLMPFTCCFVLLCVMSSVQTDLFIITFDCRQTVNCSIVSKMQIRRLKTKLDLS